MQKLPSQEKVPPPPLQKNPHVSVYLFHSDFLKTITLMPLDAATVKYKMCLGIHFAKKKIRIKTKAF